VPRPVGGDGKIYLVNEAGTAFVVQTGDKPKLLATNPLGDLCTPAISGGAVYLRSDQHLYCVGGKK